MGYGALSMEDIAARAGVHKTTVYRRWPTKARLLRDAMLRLVHDDYPELNTGSLRADLLILLQRLVDFVSSIHGQAIIRMLMSEPADPEVRELSHAVRRSKEHADRAMLDAAVARGELRPDIDVELFMGCLFGAVHARVFVQGRVADELFLARLLDLVLGGASPVAGGPVKLARRARAGVVALPRRRTSR